MNLRKFYLLSTVIISIFLFVIGVGLLSMLGHDNVSASNGDTNNYINKILEPFMVEKESVNILVLGGDKVAKNTDTIMLVNINPSTAKVNVLSIPRDTKVAVKGSSVPKINAAYPIGGENQAIETVSGLLNVKIKYFVYIDTSSFRKIIDILGGVDYNVPADMDYDDPTQNLHIHLKKGYQKLDGSKAEQFMRFRQPSHFNNEIKKFYDGSDLKRIDAQQDFIKEVIKQKTNVLYLTRMNSLVRVIYGNLETNLNMDDALKLAQNISKLRIEDVSMFKVPGEPKMENSGWYFIHDRAKTDEIVKQYFQAKSGYNGGSVNKADTKNDEKAATPAKTKKPVSPAPAKPANENVTKDNPSNAETGIEGSSKPAP